MEAETKREPLLLIPFKLYRELFACLFNRAPHLSEHERRAAIFILWYPFSMLAFGAIFCWALTVIGDLATR